MTTLDNFASDAEDDILNEFESRAREDLAPAVREHANDILREYGRANDYNVDPIIEAAETEVDRRGDAVVVRWGWPEPAIFFERGTVDHVVEARNADVLSFVWTDPPDWVREEFSREGDGWRVFFRSVEVAGLPESRFIRDTLNWLRRRFA
jgi:hypothetical protein